MRWLRFSCMLLLGLLLLAAPFALADQQLSNASDVFTPTHDWQQVSPEQPLPPGLHIRINMSSGERWVKLDTDCDLNTAECTDVRTTTGGTSRHLMAVQPDTADALSGVTPVKEVIMHKHRVSPDGEIIQTVLTALVSPEMSHQVALESLALLTDMVRDLDNAQEFIADGGLNVVRAILTTPLNDNSSTLSEQQNIVELQSTGSSLLSAVASNNPDVKHAMIENNVMSALLQAVNQTLHHMQAHVIPAKDLARLLSAVTTSLRDCPKMYDQFVAANGQQLVEDVTQRVTGGDFSGSMAQLRNKLGLLRSEVAKHRSRTSKQHIVDPDELTDHSQLKPTLHSRVHLHWDTPTCDAEIHWLQHAADHLPVHTAESRYHLVDDTIAEQLDVLTHLLDEGHCAAEIHAADAQAAIQSLHSTAKQLEAAHMPDAKTANSADAFLTPLQRIVTSAEKLIKHVDGGSQAATQPSQHSEL